MGLEEAVKWMLLEAMGEVNGTGNKGNVIDLFVWV